MAKLKLTPTQNTVLPFKTSGFKSLVDALEYAAQGESGFNFYSSQAELVSVLPYSELLDKALKLAHHFLAIGFQRGDHLPIIAENRAEFLVVFYACQYAGVIPCPFPMASSAAEREIFTVKISQMAKLVHAKFIIASAGLINAFFQGHSTDFEFISYEALAISIESDSFSADRSHFSPISKSDIAFIQFSSGSTSNPKGITIHNNDVCEHIRVILEEVMKLRADDRSLSWLPFYHNMGLIGFILASVNGQRSVDCFSPISFVSHPLLWLKLMSKNKTNITYAPMFAYQLAIKAFNEASFSDLDLSSIRVAGIGGDRIHSETMKLFSETFAPYGFDYQTFLPSYGMTEAILAISAKRAGEQVMTDVLDNKEVVSCGVALTGYQLKIVDNERALPERGVGSIYFKNNATTSFLETTLTEGTVSTDGYIDTGDIGYLYKQNLFVLGRKKDVILIRGRNIWAEDIKKVIVSIDLGVKAEDVLVMGIEVMQEERLVVMVKSNDAEDALLAMKKKIKTLISQGFKVSADIIFVKDLPLTPSGKVARERFIDIYLGQVSEGD